MIMDFKAMMDALRAAASKGKVIRAYREAWTNDEFIDNKFIYYQLSRRLDDLWEPVKSWMSSNYVITRRHLNMVEEIRGQHPKMVCSYWPNKECEEATDWVVSE